MNEAPGEGGSYALALRVVATSRADVGRLGQVDFYPGVYLYLGSALGPGGIRARLRHHLRLAAAPHWHLDWLRPHAEILGYWFQPGTQPMECVWAQGLLQAQAAQIPKVGFGSSDCTHGCPAHLLFFGTMVELCVWRNCVEEILAGLSGPVFYCGGDSAAGSGYQGPGT